jgi:DNA-binding FadR family transcriptional regulator
LKIARTIRRHKLYEDVAAEIERMILSGEYAEGDQLPSEREIMDAFGVGRTSVREALFALQKMGLVQISSGERARVTSPTAGRLIEQLAGAARHFLARPDGVRHFQQARLLFETAIARHAAEVRTSADVKRLEEALADNLRALETGQSFVPTDVRFHVILPEISGNPIFTGLYESMAIWAISVREVTGRAPGATAAAYRDHKRIFEAIKAGDPDAAATAMRNHLQRVDRLYWGLTNSKDGRPPLVTTGPDGRDELA